MTIEVVEDAIELVAQEPRAASLPATIQPPHGTTPAMLLQIAVQQGADLDRLERLMNLQAQWEDRESVKQYNQAFAAFKAEAVKLIKNKKVMDGPLKNKGYAELHAVVNAATPALSKHGLSAAWKLTKDERDWLEVTCTLKHVGGHFEAVSMGGPPDAGGAKNAIQARASTVSYLERYTFKAITGLAEQDDDTDGGDGGEDLRAIWIGRANLAKTVDEMTKVSKDGAKAFNAAKDQEGYRMFAQVVQLNGAALRKQGGAHA